MKIECLSISRLTAKLLMDFAQRKKESERLFQRVFQQIEEEKRLAPKTIATSRLIVKSFYSDLEDTHFAKKIQSIESRNKGNFMMSSYLKVIIKR